MRIHRLSAMLAMLLCIANAAAQTPSDVRYGRDIRPILADRCFTCHGPDANTREADLRLDLREHAIAMQDGVAAIVPGDPDNSLLWERVQSHDDSERMPPQSSGKKALQGHELQLIRRWIEAGATYEQHWSFVPPQPVEVPPGEESHPIDAFLRAANAGQGFEPNAPADAATLCRRLYLVLTGLPPTPEELAEFAADERADAYERLVDKLLTEEPYATRHAEHLAGIWLDAGRYADTSGIHMDAGRQAYLWRNWLIDALRNDKPFDEFVVEQLAGDLLPDATVEQRIATGFLRNHVTTDEGGAINEEYLVEYAAERTATVGSVFLGLTIGCARCHDHKYDPIRQQDYYRLFSFFNNNEEPGLYRQSKNAFRALEPKIAAPTDGQLQQQSEIEAAVASAESELSTTTPAEQASYGEFLASLPETFGLDWQRPIVDAAESLHGATLTVDVDGSVRASGESPRDDTHVLSMHTAAVDQRWLCLEGLTDESLPGGRVGRASHGNIVLQYLQLQVRPVGRDAEWRDVSFRYAFADVEQENGDFVVGNVLADDERGWAPAAHQGPPSPRVAMLLADEPFTYPQGTELRLTLKYDSRYKQHVFGRVRVATSATTAAGLEQLPLAISGKHVAGPFVPAGLKANGTASLYDTDFGPQAATHIDDRARFGERSWRFDAKWNAAGRHLLESGQNVHYVAQRIWVPSDRTTTFSFGSDDGWQLFLDGKRIGEKRVNRGVAEDQERQQLQLTAGEHLLVLKIVNTGGAGGFAMRHVPRDDELPADMRLALLPHAQGNRLRFDRVTRAYHEHYSPAHKQRVAALAALKKQLDDLQKAIPEAMVMQERAQMRPTFVLERGEYDKADAERPVVRELPQMFGTLPADAPKNRLGLARWLVSDQNPLLLRVASNRLWEFVFGTGIVRTSEDFGLQGEWPSHPELLDWLALEFRNNGHSTRKLLRLMVTSRAFRQQARRNPAAERDSDNRYLTWFPRRRLTAEAIRDQALYVAGLLVERTGGPSVKPYQPEGLWKEVAMVQSNTRNFRRDDGDALWRRSLYTYWKRACPPPSLSTFDAPTREFCTIRRSVTNTPLQALVLWNDEQFVEAARMLAQRAMHEHQDDSERLRTMYLRTTGQPLRGKQENLAAETLRELQRRYRSEPAAAAQLLQVGEQPADAELPAPDLAAFTMLASAFLDLDATLYID